MEVVGMTAQKAKPKKTNSVTSKQPTIVVGTTHEAFTWETVEPFAKSLYYGWRYKAEAVGDTLEDLRQEALFVYCKCIGKFKGPKGLTDKSVEGRKMFQKFYGFCAENHFKTKYIRSRTKTPRKDVIDDSVRLVPGEVFSIRANHPSSGLGDFMIRVTSEASKDVKKVLDLIFESPVEVLESLGLSGRGAGTGFAVNKRVCAAIGVDHREKNVVNEVRQFLLAR
jgi:hypothetical protein